MEIKAKIKMHDYDSFVELIKGAIGMEEVEKEFYNCKKEKSKRSAQSFSMGLRGNQPLKKVNTFGQSHQSFRASIELGVDSFAFTSPEQKRTE